MKREFSRSFALGLPLQLEITSTNGRIEVRGEQREDALVTCTIETRGTSEEDLDAAQQRVEAGIHASGDRLAIEAPAFDETPLPGPFRFATAPSTRVRYELRVPVATRATVEARNGPVEIEHLEGPVSLRNRNGPVRIEDVKTAVVVATRNGPLRLRQCGASVEAGGENGPIVIERAAGPIKASCTNGPLSLEDIEAEVIGSTTNGPISFKGAVGGSIDLSTRNGPINLRVPGDSRFEVDAKSERGPVLCEIAVHDQAPEGAAPRPRVRLRTANSPIQIRRL